MFLTEVYAIVKKGLKSNYVNYNDNLQYLKGKLVAGEHIYRTV